MTESDLEAVPIKVSTLEIIHNSLIPLHHKVTSLVEGHYKKEYVFSRMLLIPLLEIKISSEILNSLLEEVISEALEHNSPEVFMEKEEIFAMTSILHSLSSAETTTLGPVSMSTN